MRVAHSLSHGRGRRGKGRRKVGGGERERTRYSWPVEGREEEGVVCDLPSPRQGGGGSKKSLGFTSTGVLRRDCETGR